MLVHPDIYWMGCSPDGIIYDPNENPFVGILEIKCLFAMNRGMLRAEERHFRSSRREWRQDPDEIIDTTFNFRT